MLRTASFVSHPLPQAMKLEDSEETTEENTALVSPVNNDNDNEDKNQETRKETIHINLSDRKMITELVEEQILYLSLVDPP